MFWALCTAADLVAEDDVGLVIAKAVIDSRTANKTVAILANALTQNATIATWQELSGQSPDRKDTSAEEMQQKIDGENMPCVTSQQVLLMLHSEILSSATFLASHCLEINHSLSMHASSCVHFASHSRKHTPDAVEWQPQCYFAWCHGCCTIETLLMICAPSQHWLGLPQQAESVKM